MIVILIFWLVKLVPWMLLKSLNIDTFGGIGHENLLNDVLGIVREELWKRVISIHDLLVQVGCLLILKWQVPAEHGIQNDTTTPNV